MKDKNQNLCLPKIIVTSLWIFVMLFAYTQTEYNEAEAADDSISTQSFKVYASCDTYIEVDAPNNLQTQYNFVTSRNSPPQLTGTLIQSANESYTTHSFKSDFPGQGWFSVLFEGPPFAINRFCYGNAKTNKVYMSYKPAKNFVMAYSIKPEFSSQEIDKTNSNTNRSLLHLKSEGPNKSRITAGRNSQNPYWLTFSHNYNFHEPISTSLQYTVP